MNGYHDILFELEEGIARLTLNRPDKLNSFTARMHEEVADALARVEAGGARVLLVRGAGRGFCAGQDLSERQPSADGQAPDLGATIERHYAPLVRRLQALPLPVVMGVNGVAAGAGANLALAGDLVIACESASFIQSFARLGLLPDTGGTWSLPRRVGLARAMGLALLGERLPARQAQEWGLIWQCVPDQEFEETLQALVRRLAAAPTLGLAYTKRAILQSGRHGMAEQLDLERDLMRELGRSHDYREGVQAFLEKREPVFKGK
ncbi:2-(1,2-epoxy-1,2-dihydrophenyl)acetyl-CoA isomerase PaaG [Orrella sp. JC864]|uniref:2-(1,2-epoxy-1,2-dihydrophenyl)acetyl-CoA isomerase PaaG n=1 Tax=Orrella sp. JC864 TaxID=3120298 RepID=UPI0012BCA841